MHQEFVRLLATASLAVAVSAQSITVPIGTATTEGNSNNTFPWASTSTTIPGLRVQNVYDSSNFTGQGVTSPIVITRVRWRANGTTSTWVGGTYANASVAFSTCPVDQSAVTANFAAQQGADYQVCYSGPVSYLAGTGAGTTVPGPTVVDVTLSTPFVYNPNLGDLVLDTDCLLGANFTANGTGTNRVALDVQTTGALASRCYASTSYPAATAVTTTHGVVATLDYVPAAGLYAGFSANVVSGPSPLTVTFTDSTYTSDAGGVTSWAWDFDGDSVVDSTAQNPTFTYTTCGAFNVSLTVTDASHPASTITRTGYIRTDDITASFTASLLVAPNVYQLTDTSTPAATAWAWDTDGDGIDDSFTQNPLIVLPLCQSVNVRLTATRNCRSSQATQTLFVAANTLGTPFNASNGGSSGWIVMSDLNVTNPKGITLCGMGHNTGTTTVGTPFTYDVYLTDTGYAGKDNDITKWRLAGTGSGVAKGNNVVSPAGLNSPIHIPFGTFGMAVQINGASVRYTGTTTTQPILTVSNADLSLSTGVVRSTLFAGGSFFSVRNWNGELYYDTATTNFDAAYGFMGLGCAGTLPPSRQTVVNPPVMGSNFGVAFDNLPSSLTLVLLGFSNTFATGFGPLPLDVSVIGMTGCIARVSPDLSFFTIGGGNAAQLLVSIPIDPAFLSVPMYTQALTPDATGNTFGWVLSDAAGGLIGN